MTPELTRQLDDLKYCQNLAFDVLLSLSDEQLLQTVGKPMGTLGEQFRHMARVRQQYAEAIETKKVAQNIEEIPRSVATNKDELIVVWNRATKRISNALDQLSDEEKENLAIDWNHWGIASMSIHEHIQALIDHENLHNGEIVVYCRLLNIPFPDSWKAWGM